jgi:hypothetical protein
MLKIVLPGPWLCTGRSPGGKRVISIFEEGAAVPKKSDSLTPKQAAVLEYVKQCIENDNRTPTIRQVGSKFKYRSTASGRDIVTALVKKGELIKDPALARGVRLNPKKYAVKVIRNK